eukprot:5533376-Alexandrium_andersonii.AAC.1
MHLLLGLSTGTSRWSSAAMRPPKPTCQRLRSPSPRSLARVSSKASRNGRLKPSHWSPGWPRPLGEALDGGGSPKTARKPSSVAKSMLP